MCHRHFLLPHHHIPNLALVLSEKHDSQRILSLRENQSHRQGRWIAAQASDLSMHVRLAA